jgi:hypothetical protein
MESGIFIGFSAERIDVAQLPCGRRPHFSFSGLRLMWASVSQ